MLIWTLVEPLVTWTPTERQQRLFHVCVQVQARLMARYPDYHTVTPQTVPDALAEEVKEIVYAILRDAP